MTWLNHRILALIEEIIHTSQDCDAVRTGERWDAATPSQPIALLQVNRSQEKHEPVGTNVNVLTSRIVFSPRRGMASKSMQRTTPREACGRMTASDQLQPLQTRMPVLADDNMVVHGDAERGGDLDDRFGHVDVGLRGCGIAGGVVVQDTLETTHRIEKLTRTPPANSDQGRQ